MYWIKGHMSQGQRSHGLNQTKRSWYWQVGSRQHQVAFFFCETRLTLCLIGNFLVLHDLLKGQWLARSFSLLGRFHIEIQISLCPDGLYYSFSLRNWNLGTSQKVIKKRTESELEFLVTMNKFFKKSSRFLTIFWHCRFFSIKCILFNNQYLMLWSWNAKPKLLSVAEWITVCLKIIFHHLNAYNSANMPDIIKTPFV